MEKRRYLRRCAGRRELIGRVCSLAGLSVGKGTTTIFTKVQLLELESYLRNAKAITEKFYTTPQKGDKNGTTYSSRAKAAAARR